MRQIKPWLFSRLAAECDETDVCPNITKILQYNKLFYSECERQFAGHSVHLPVRLQTSKSVWLAASHLSFCPSVCVPVSLPSVFLSVWLLDSLPFCPSTHLPAICLSVCKYVTPLLGCLSLLCHSQPCADDCAVTSAETVMWSGVFFQHFAALKVSSTLQQLPWWWSIIKRL